MSDYYHYQNSCCGTAHAYLLPSLSQIFADLAPPEKRIFDLGCGNGSIANWLSEKGFQVSGCDPSESGIAEAKKAYPELDLYVGSAYDDLASKFGTFPLLISLEVVEHVYAPRNYAKTVYNLLQPGGYALISTPYHSYLKNLALAATGKMDEHFTALWDHGHIKFWSVKTISEP
ncbi:class I SAM-dependent methyltransferase [Microcystis flos-aquae]|uniref:class I SAM-dependent methyltransferase n=1 Tax=Microcystis flos-aquae TaxID=109615 RepID=UPI001F54DF42|nr:methyltransferase domain-containing protein [Microcystis flos-aquae]